VTVDAYDSPWKEAVERYFSQFLHFYFPQVHAEIDWCKPYIFLDKELLAIFSEAELGPRFVDKLVRVTRRSGATEWIYLHLEIQGTQQDQFAERMFIYHYRLYDKYRKPIASLALLTDDRTNWRPDNFGYDVCGCQLKLRFPIAKLIDWSSSDEQLADNHNPFAFITRAHLKTMSTRHQPLQRYSHKRQLLLDLHRHGWNRRTAFDLYKILDWMMRLPDDLDKALWEDVKKTEEGQQMRYVSSFERILMDQGFKKGLEQGIERGIEQGIEQGIERGITRGEAKLIERLLQQRFGDLPAWARQRLSLASESELTAWADVVLTADSLESILGSSPH